MSRRSFPIYFDDKPRIDQVVLAVAPMDAFSARLVTSGVKARVKGLADRPIKNLSGHLVFINLPTQDEYAVTVDASEAGYFSPVESKFEPPKPNGPGENRRHLVKLTPRPDFPFEDTATLIRGMVVRGKKEVEGALIWAAFSGALRFETWSDKRGAFALPFTIPRLRRPKDKNSRLIVTLHLEHGNDRRQLNDLVVVEARSHSFAEPIDLTGTNTPPFFDPYQH